MSNIGEINISEREGVPWYQGERKEKGKMSFWQCTQSNTLPILSSSELHAK